MGRQQHRQASRQQHPPRDTTASKPAGTELAKREDTAPEIVRSDGEKDILRALSKPAMKQAIALRLGQLFGPEEMIAMVSTLLRQSPLLAKCDPMTVIGAVLEVAQVGLRLDRTLGQAYLVPFFSSKRKCYEAQLILGYRGMITLAEHAERVVAVRARIVYKNDRFEYEEGLNPVLRHHPCDARDRGEPTHVYAVIHKADGFASPYVMPWWKIDDLAQAQIERGNLVWKTNKDEMGLKTAIRRGLKYHPLAPKQQRLANLDELAEAGVEQGLEFSGQAAVEQIEESAEAMASAREQARIEGEVGGVVSDGSSEGAGASSVEPTAPPDPGRLSAAEEAAFEAAQQSKGGA